MKKSRTRTVLIRRASYDRAIEHLERAYPSQIRITSGISAGTLPYFHVCIVRGPLAGFSYDVVNDHRQLVLSEDGHHTFRAGETIGVRFHPRDPIADPRDPLALDKDGPARELALTHVSCFVALLDTFHKEA